jgi:hypothetical protein
MAAGKKSYVVKNIQKNLNKSSLIYFGEMAERLKAVDCKSIELSHRRFESYFLLTIFLHFNNSKYSAVGSAPVLGTGGHVFKSHYFEIFFLFVKI